jgi:hypothetical protein
MFLLERVRNAIGPLRIEGKLATRAFGTIAAANSRAGFGRATVGPGPRE